MRLRSVLREAATAHELLNVRRYLRRIRRYLYGRSFDHRYGTETTDMVLNSAHRGARHGYEPSETWLLPRVLPPSWVSPTDVFADIGCGKGRALLVAVLHYSFRRAVGVEVSPELLDIAQRNVTAVRRRSTTRVDLVAADAELWEIPPDVTVFYLFNPFAGETFRRFVAKVVESQTTFPRRVFVVYARPVMADCLVASGFRLVRHRRNLHLYLREEPSSATPRQHRRSEDVGTA